MQFCCIHGLCMHVLIALAVLRCVACRYNTLTSAQGDMDDKWDYDLLESYKPALSVLFNAFILGQVSNLNLPFKLCTVTAIGREGP